MKYAEMSFPVGNRTYVIRMDLKKRLVTEGWEPSAPLRVDWLPTDQMRQMIEARQKFLAAIAKHFGVDRADLTSGYANFRPLRMEER